MIVFKNYLKIVKSLLPSILIFMGIFLGFSIVLNLFNNTTTNFSKTKPNVAIINKDNSKITDSFYQYISENTALKTIKNEENEKKDALFYHSVDYILIIPENFGKSIMAGSPLSLETLKVPNSADSIFIEMMLNQFIQTALIYQKSGMKELEIADNLNKTFKSKNNVNMISTSFSNLDKMESFFNFANYVLLTICILVIGMVIRTYNDKMIKKRTIVSSTPYRKINTILFAGNAMITLITWLLFAVIAMIFYPQIIFKLQGCLFLLNSFALAFVACSIGSLIGNLITNKEAQSGLVNIIALGSSFLCGAFVPQEFLGSSVLQVARILPSYWYIKNNEFIANLSNFNFESLSPFFFHIVIILSFGILFFIINQIISSRKRSNS